MLNGLPVSLLGVIVGVAIAPDSSQVDSAARQIRGSVIAGHVQVLASDRFEGRAPGTQGEKLTLAYVEKQFRKMGLTPAYGTSFRQLVPLSTAELLRAPEFKVSQVTGSPASPDINFKVKDDFVGQLGSPRRRVSISGAPIVFVGFGTTAPEFGWDDYYGVDVRGKVVAILRGDPGTSTEDPARFSGRNATIHSVVSEKIRNAASHGARAVIIIHDDSAGYPWVVLAAGGLGRTQSFLKPEKRESHVEAVYFMSESAGRSLLKAGGMDLGAERKAAASPGFNSRQLSGVTVSLRLSAHIKPIVSHNLIGIVPGQSRSAQCLLLMAHWDHMGRDASLKGDQIFNGAVDNATGVGTLIEIGRALKSLKAAPRRTIILAATTAEERGLLGAEYLARNPICPIKATIGAIAIDALFPFGPDTHMTVTGFGSSELEDLLAQSAAKYGRKLQDDGQPQAGANYRADHYRFLRKGVPGFLAVGGPANDVPDKDPQAAALIDYVQHKYHRPSDEYDAATWDMRGIEGDARVLFDFAWRAANDQRTPNWYWTSPLRPVHDASQLAKPPSNDRR